MNKNRLDIANKFPFTYSEVIHLMECADASG